MSERSVESNVDNQVGYWLKSGTPVSKIIVGIPTYGRSWKMTSDSGLTGVPPLTVGTSYYNINFSKETHLSKL